MGDLSNFMTDMYNKGKQSYKKIEKTVKPYVDAVDKVIYAPRDTIVTPINKQAKRALEDTQTVYGNLPENLQKNPFVRAVKGATDRVNSVVALASTPTKDIPQVTKDTVSGTVQAIQDFSKDPVGNIVNYYTDEYNDPWIPLDIASIGAGAVSGARGLYNIANKGSIVKGGVKAPTTQIQNASELNVKTNIPSLEGKTNVINDNGTLKYKNTTDINKLPKQQPISRTTDARPVQGEVKSFEELPKVKEPIKATEIEQGILTEKDLDKLKKSNIVKRATEYSESNDAIMKHLEEQYGGRENLDNLLDAVSNMNPEEYAQWKTAYLAHQKGALHGGNPADVLANRANKTNIDLNLAFGDEMLAAYSPHTGDISLAPEIFIKTHKRPFVGVSQNETITNALQHEMLHDLNMQAEMANKFKIDNTREAAIYNKRHNYPKSTNESASFGFESVDLGNQPLNPEIISGYENVGYNAELSNPQMLMQRKLYGEDIGRYKTLVEAGILKPTDLQILNEQNLMRRFDPNYQSPLDTMYLKTFDQIGNGGGV